MGLFDKFKKKQDNSGSKSGLDYSSIDSNAKAEALFEKCELVKLYLMPLDLGGEDSPINTLYVPEFANIQKNKFDDQIYDLLQSGLKLGYSANPEYKDRSFIPSKIVIHLKGDKTQTEIINIW